MSLPRVSHPDQRYRLLPAGSAALVLLLFWAQALFVPYWQDDYYYLLDARNARLAGESWLAPFFPAEKTNFWRPLGMESYWRFVEGVLGGDVVAAHAINVLLLLASAAAVGWFAATFVRLHAPGPEARPAGALAFFLYGVHASHFLPAAWAAAANDSLAVLFAALALRGWLVATTASPGRGGWAAGLTPLWLTLALLSRDGAIVLPALGLLLTLWLRPRYKPSRMAWQTAAICLAIALAWLLLRDRFTLPPDPAYAMRLGWNVARNAGALVLFLFNVPFEALRFFFYVTPSAWFLVWGLACFALQAAACIMMVRAARARLGRKGLLLLVGFFVIGCAPYYWLSVNCYPYYTALGLIAYAILAATAGVARRQLAAVLILSTLSSALATLGNYPLAAPSHIGRARWAERQLVTLQALYQTRPQFFAAPLVVVVEDEHRYLGFRKEGLAYRLGLPVADIVVVYPGEETPGQRRVLVVPGEGDVYFRETPPRF